MPPTDTTIIAAPAELDSWLVPNADDLLALDTEFVRERTYYAQLGLVQLARRGTIALVDPLEAGCADALTRMLQRSPTVVMHSASEDLEALRVACHALPLRMLDTQIAASLAGMGAGLSLQKLIEATVGVLLPKSETRTDWLRRPLSDAQLAYAADDVRHLVEAAGILTERLRNLGRLEWVEEDCARMLEAARDDRIPADPHLAFRPAQRLAPAAQLRVRRLLIWRDVEARRSNKPRGWILDNALVVRLSERPPGQRAAMDQLLDTTPGAPRKHRDVLWDELTRPATDVEQAMPLAVAPESLDRAALKKMQDAVIRVAAALELPESALAARRHLESLLAEQRWPAALEGWRRPLLEDALAFAIR